MKQVRHHGYVITVRANNEERVWRGHAIITWEQRIIGLAYNAKTENISARSERPVMCTTTSSVLTRNHGRKHREVMDAEIDISDVIE